MKVKEQDECGNKEGYSNGYNLLIKDLVKKKKKKKEEEQEQAVKYNECRKNHAAKIGRYAVDGCCEFMAAGEEGTTGALRCAACNCHRNFHRREIVIHLSNSSSSNSI